MDTFFVSLIDFSFLHLFFPPSPSLFFPFFFLHWELSPRGLLQAKQAFCPPSHTSRWPKARSTNHKYS